MDASQPGIGAGLRAVCQYDRAAAEHHSSAVARIIEYGSRAVADHGQLLTRFDDIADLVHEAAHLGGRNSHAAVTATDVHAAEEVDGSGRTWSRNASYRKLSSMGRFCRNLRQGSRPDQRPFRSELGRLQFRRSHPAHGHGGAWAARRGEYRARSGVERPHSRQGRLDPYWLSFAKVRKGGAAYGFRELGI